MPNPQLDPEQQKINWLGTALTAFLCALLTYITIALVNGTVQPTFRDVVIGLVGFITAKLSTVYDWCFGTSSSSKKQQETIALQAKTAAGAQAALAPLVTPGPQPGDKVVLQPGDHVDVAAAPTKPDDMTQEAWDALTDDEKKTHGKK